MVLLLCPALVQAHPSQPEQQTQPKGVPSSEDTGVPHDTDGGVSPAWGGAWRAELPGPTGEHTPMLAAPGGKRLVRNKGGLRDGETH